MQPLSIDDYPTLQQYINHNDQQSSNTNFIALFMWQGVDSIQFELHDHFLILLYKNIRDQIFFAAPFCHLEYYQEAIDYMISYANTHQFTFKICMAIESITKDIKAIYHKQFVYQRTPENDDYIYSRKSLETLSGKKMQKKRNHYRAFIRDYPQYHYKEIETLDIPHIKDRMIDWYNDEMDPILQHEYEGILSLLKNRQYLSLMMGCIYINHTVEAIIIGSMRNDNTLQIHVEKANKNIRGIFIAIEKLFLENAPAHYLYVNREEDMGLANLRKAKQSLHPIHMITKYKITSRHIQIRIAKREDKDRIRQLWLACFSDETIESTDYYFQYYYKEQYTYVLLQETTIVSALQIVPFALEGNKTIYFIEGVCTDENYRNNGFMKELLEHVLQQEPFASHTLYLQAYTPSIYYPFGFHDTYFLHKVIVDRTHYASMTNCHTSTISPELLLQLYKQYCESFHGYRLRSLAYYHNLKRRAKSLNENIVGIYEGEQLLGYTQYQEDTDTITITEIIYLSALSLETMISYFTATSDKKITIYCDTKATIYGTKERVCNMLTNNKERINDTLFINEIY